MSRGRHQALPLVVGLGLLALAVYLGGSEAAARAPLAPHLDLELPPGGAVEVPFRGERLVLAVPAGEGRSAGTLVLRSGATELLTLDRDGAPEAAWRADLDRDGEEELLLVLRSAGSGSYAGLVELDREGVAWSARPLPELGGPGYGGHGRVTVRVHTRRELEAAVAVVEQDYPLYGRHLELADDPVGTLLEGRAPVTLEHDSNATPEGGTARVRFDRARWAWVATGG